MCPAAGAGRGQGQAWSSSRAVDWLAAATVASFSVTHCDSVTERPARLEISAFLRCRRAAGLRLATLVTFLAAACYGGLVWCGVG